MTLPHFLKKGVRVIIKPARVMKRKIDLFQRRRTGNQKCQACGFQGRFNSGRVLWPALIEEWELEPEWVNWFDLREGQSCPNCYSSLRAGQLSDAIIEGLSDTPNTNGMSLREVFGQKRIQILNIAEINSAGTLHPFLAKCANLRYSEFGSEIPSIPSEDLMKLSYADKTFDLVVTSETLEHVPDIDVALSEIHRILKPNGMHIFTIPIVCDRAKTRQRAHIQNGNLIHLFPPSYHGGVNEGKSDFLVFYEFGADFVPRCENIGFHVVVKLDDANPALVTFITRKIA